ncbi:succinate dehydrogenase, cytochrome b556 subunit [Afifella sp. IM 167]|uniref:succinate dehydrogenase, cytochrome b556 subunit n=1 Tax=Afifella sp. IM 167 TaxID=2033586 RepID=UPI001CCC4A62|nr:succinate dehydrogenase, cytochrome b556 subunit [Afifella sp. IM 167]MBZ8132662.1 succinate dehydrogenase, cytochrome b556 subunit [Afifella sp. IM 167]
MTDTSESRRPLSPFVQIFRWPVTMAASLAHRITAMVLYGGSILFAFWLVSLAWGPQAFDFATMLFGTWLGWLVLFVFTWMLMQHIMGGIRHFIWDTAMGLDKPTVDLMARASMIGGIGLTLILWIAVLIAL